MTNSAFKLVIFDMDGTLVDSEAIADLAVSETTRLLDRYLSPEEARELFRGRDSDFMMKELTAMNGGPLSEDFLLALYANYTEALSTKLLPTKGAQDVVKVIKEKANICVASNGEPEDIAYSLKSAGLSEYFGEHTYSFRDVARPKPAPDLFLHAAAQFNAAPDECLVIEDSPVGLRAAREAGMPALGFCGNEPSDRALLEATGYPVTDDFVDVLKTFEAGRGA